MFLLWGSLLSSCIGLGSVFPSWPHYGTSWGHLETSWGCPGASSGFRKLPRGCQGSLFVACLAPLGSFFESSVHLLRFAALSFVVLGLRGAFSEAQMAPRRPQEGPKRAPRKVPDEDHEPKILAFRPKRHPGGPKRPPRGPKRPPRGPQEAQKRPQEAPKQLPRSLQTASRRPPRGFSRRRRSSLLHVPLTIPSPAVRFLATSVACRSARHLVPPGVSEGLSAALVPL